MSVELPLSIKTRLVLNPSSMSMMTRWSSCGRFTSLASSSEKTISRFSLLRCFDGGHRVDTINLSLLRLFKGLE